MQRNHSLTPDDPTSKDGEEEEEDAKDEIFERVKSCYQNLSSNLDRHVPTYSNQETLIDGEGTVSTPVRNRSMSESGASGLAARGFARGREGSGRRMLFQQLLCNDCQTRVLSFPPNYFPPNYSPTNSTPTFPQQELKKQLRRQSTEEQLREKYHCLPSASTVPKTDTKSGHGADHESANRDTNRGNEELKQFLGNRFNTIDTKLILITSRLDQMEKRFQEMKLHE